MYEIGYLSYDPLKILNILAISLSDNIILKNLFTILLDNNVSFSRTHIR